MRRWDGHGADEVDLPKGSFVPGVHTVDACLASCIDAPDFSCEGVLWNRDNRHCYRKTNLTYAECMHDPAFDLHARTDTRFIAKPPPPYSSKISPATCDVLLSDPQGMLKQMWNRVGWRQIRGEEPCWGWDDPDAFFDNVIAGTTCNSNWYEGSIGWQQFHSDAPGVLGFDDAIGYYCGGLPWGRRLAEGVNSSDAVGQYIEEGHNEAERSHRRNLADAARVCVDRSRNILMLFGNNVHNVRGRRMHCPRDGHYQRVAFSHHHVRFDAASHRRAPATTRAAISSGRRARPWASCPGSSRPRSSLRRHRIPSTPTGGGRSRAAAGTARKVAAHTPTRTMISSFSRCACSRRYAPTTGSSFSYSLVIGSTARSPKMDSGSCRPTCCHRGPGELWSWYYWPVR